MKQLYLRCLLWSGFSLLTSSLVMAQLPNEQASIPQPRYAEMGFFARYLHPTDALWANGYRPGGGFSMEVMSRPLRTDRVINLQFGGNANFDFAGSQSFEIPVTYPYPTDAELELNNSQLGLHGVARLITTDRFPIQGYLQGMVGSRWFISQETLTLDVDHDDDFYDDCPEPETETLHSQLVLSYGGAAGMRVRLSPGFWLDLRGSYLKGSQASFVDLGTASLAEAGVVTYDLASSPRTDQWAISAGITFELNGTCTPSRSRVGSLVPMSFGIGGCH
jgi:hypothetical protein